MKPWQGYLIAALAAIGAADLLGHVCLWLAEAIA